MFQPDEWQQKALKTFNGGDDPTRHALLGLVGEAGELIELYKKHEYKPGFNWWDCKHCQWDRYSHNSENLECPSALPNMFYTPKVLDELGDYSYYLRILAYQRQVTFEELCKTSSPEDYKDNDILQCLTRLNFYSAQLLEDFYVWHFEVVKRDFEILTSMFLAILAKLDTPLEQVLELNYRKLNSEPTAHGWSQ